MADAPTLLALFLKRTLRDMRHHATRMDVKVEDVASALFRDVEAAETRLTVTLRFSKQEGPRG